MEVDETRSVVDGAGFGGDGDGHGTGVSRGGGGARRSGLTTPVDPLPALHALDPAGWDTGLSPENARASWAAALSCVDAAALRRPVGGRPPRKVLLIASRGVFTAPLEWLLHLHARGVPVLLKPAQEQVAACRAMASVIPGVEVREWAGGDEAAEAAAVAEVDAVLVFGKASTVAEVRRRVPPGKVFLGFGPKFGVSVVDTIGDATVEDHTLYDGRGCMSPAAVFARHIDLDSIATRMAAAEAAAPRGPLSPAEAAAIRARTILARAVGERRSGPGWAVLRLPLAQFSPEALPRVLLVHSWTTLDDVRATLAPWQEQLGTVATDQAFSMPGVRMCRPGAMQRPELARDHDGVDVLGALWRA